jgi:predicted esterase
MKGLLISTKTYRYFTKGEIDKANTLIYALHGYGQLAEYFIRKFRFQEDEYFVVSPEGMHRFYLNGSSGRVGASWMTKEERESDISDNIHWLDDLHEHIMQQKHFKRVIIFGFSQGGATAARWFYNGKVKADQLIVWASVFPPDLLIENEILSTSQDENIFFIGDQDEYYSAGQQMELIKFYQSKGFKTIHYKGKHDIDPSVLMSELINGPT